MKKAIAIILCIISLFTLVSCGETSYPPVESTEEEARVVMTISYEGKKYEVKYELYRALFLNFKKEIDGGDDSVWSGDNKEAYINRIDELIFKRVSEIYAVFHICDKIGIDIYADKYDKMVDNYIVASVEGGSVGADGAIGFGGDYDKYLEHLKSMNLNYSVSTLMIRYTLALEEIDVYYRGIVDYDKYGEVLKPGNLEYTDEDIEEFYNSSECVRVLCAYLPTDYFTKERAEEIRNTIVEKNGETNVSNYINSIYRVKTQMIIAKHNLDSQYYGELVDEAFSLKAFDTSKVIELFTGEENAYMILYRAAKSEEHFENYRQDIVDAYAQNEIGKMIYETASSINDKISYTGVELDHSAISME